MNMRRETTIDLIILAGVLLMAVGAWLLWSWPGVLLLVGFVLALLGLAMALAREAYR